MTLIFSVWDRTFSMFNVFERWRKICGHFYVFFAEQIPELHSIWDCMILRLNSMYTDLILFHHFRSAICSKPNNKVEPGGTARWRRRAPDSRGTTFHASWLCQEKWRYGISSTHRSVISCHPNQFFSEDEFLGTRLNDLDLKPAWCS